MKAKLLAVLFTLCIASASLFAQEKGEISSKKLSGGFGHTSFIAQQINIGNLNNVLTANGYGNISTTQLAWGGGGNFVFNNFMIGGEGAGFIGSRTSNGFNSMNLKGGYGFLNVGYAFSADKKGIFYPMIGAGLAGFDMYVRKKDANANFEDQINSPSGSAVINAGGFVLNAQLAYQHFFFFEGKSGILLGLKAGYRYSPSSWNMDINGNRLNNAPAVNMNGFYAGIIIGGGGLGRY